MSISNFKTAAISFGFGFAGACTAIAVAAGPKASEEVVTKKFTLVNSAGKPVIMMMTDGEKGHPRLLVKAADEKSGVSLRVDEETGRGQVAGLSAEYGTKTGAVVGVSEGESRVRVFCGDQAKFAAVNATKARQEFVVMDGKDVHWRSK